MGCAPYIWTPVLRDPATIYRDACIRGRMYRLVSPMQIRYLGRNRYSITVVGLARALTARGPLGSAVRNAAMSNPTLLSLECVMPGWNAPEWPRFARAAAVGIRRHETIRDIKNRLM